jgi:hypothetical protein
VRDEANNTVARAILLGFMQDEGNNSKDKNLTRHASTSFSFLPKEVIAINLS